MDALDALAELELVDCFDDEDDLDLDEVTPELAFLHRFEARRGALDAEVARYGLDAVCQLMVRGLTATARLQGRSVAVVPDELARFLQADDAYWVNLMCGLWYDAGEVCGAARRDPLGELEEWCILPPHDGPGGHGWDRRNVAVSW